MSVKTCTQCGNCVDQCPVYALLRQEQTSPKGKQAILKAAGDKLYAWKRCLELTRLCAGCERCAMVCPANLSVPESLAQARAEHGDWVKTAWKIWVRYGSLLWPTASLSSRMLGYAHGAEASPVLTGSAARSGNSGFPLPKGSAALMRSAAAMRAASQGDSAGAPWIRFTALPGNQVEEVRPQPALLFSGCTARNVRPGWTATARRLLQAAGFDVLDASAFTCCGSTLHHAGLLEEARKARLANFEVWNKAGRPPVFTFCASCHHGLTAYAPVLVSELAPDLAPELVEAWLASLRPLSTLLVKAAPRPTGDAPARPAYHQPCHRTGQDPDMAFLRAAFPELHKGSELCCGMGGVLKLTHALLSERLAARCRDGLAPEGSGVDAVISGCSGCVLQLTSAFPPDVKVRHWLDVVEI